MKLEQRAGAEGIGQAGISGRRAYQAKGVARAKTRSQEVPSVWTCREAIVADAEPVMERVWKKVKGEREMVEDKLHEALGLCKDFGF